VLKEAEELAFVEESHEHLVRGQFNAGTVYEEYAKSLGLLGRLAEAMAYYEKAEKYFSAIGEEQRRASLLATTKAIVLVYGGEIREGVEVATHAIHLCRESGNMRQLERIYGIHIYLEKLSFDISKYARSIKDLLIDQVEY
jgi:tetratricopeptide (TPR) repeat protein